MKDNVIKKGKVEALAKSLEFGFYRVTEEGKFLECDPKARAIFGLPGDQSNLSKCAIEELYVIPEEREQRLKKLIEGECGPFSGTLSLRVKGKNKLLFDICWCGGPYQGEKSFFGLISEIENSTIFPKMFDTFPMGLYELDNAGIIVRVNRELLKILRYKDEGKILNRPYRDFCEDEEVLNRFVREIDEKGSAHGLLRLRDAHKKIIEVECFAQNINEFGRARWGMLNDVTERVSYTRAVEMMPTGFYHIEHPANDKNHKHERITLCNERFANIIGLEKKEDAIGINVVRDIHLDKETGDKFFKALHEADERDEPLLNYSFKSKRLDNDRIIHISLDVHLLKDSEGRIIGREGTVRDTTEEVELKNRVKETEERMKKTTEDINSFVHTFLHPVVQFAGDSELLHQVGNTLYQSIIQGMLSTPDEKEDIRELGKKLINKLIDIRDIISDTDEEISCLAIEGELSKNEKRKFFTMSDLRKELTLIINTFDYSLESEESDILLEGDVRSTALWVLEEFNKLGCPGNDILKPFIKRDIIEFLQGILFKYLIQSANALEGETKSMKRGVETLRDHIGLKEGKKEKKYAFREHDVGEILEKNIEQLRAAFLERNIEIDYKKGAGNHRAEISQLDLDRVISNLLLNARKYSFSGKGRFVKINVKELGYANHVEFSITSYGVPIKQEEIKNKSIWKFGSRGELAYRYDRDGTGVGLADAQEVIEKVHGGKIWLTSRPAKDDGPPPQYNVPYITTVTIRLPKNKIGTQRGVNYV